MAHLSSSLHRDPAGSSASGRTPRRPKPAARGVVGVVAVLAMALAGCQQESNPEAQRIDQLNLKIEQLEQRVNKLASERRDGSDRQGKPPSGRIKSLTLRTGTEDDRLRIYWADGSTTDLPCTKEQATFVCG
jgi:outer membrane murein-binding lipoprotein Lpp